MRKRPTALSPYDPSLDRQTLDRLLEEFRSVVAAFCDPQPLLRGRIQELARRCGKKRCRCARGALHKSIVFVDRSGPRRKLRTVDPKERYRLRKLTLPYRTLRHLRARLPHLAREALACGERLVAFRLAGKRPPHFP
jgi:hypothetical protein